MLFFCESSGCARTGCALAKCMYSCRSTYHPRRGLKLLRSRKGLSRQQHGVSRLTLSVRPSSAHTTARNLLALTARPYPGFCSRKTFVVNIVYLNFALSFGSCSPPIDKGLCVVSNNVFFSALVFAWTTSAAEINLFVLVDGSANKFISLTCFWNKSPQKASALKRHLTGRDEHFRALPQVAALSGDRATLMAVLDACETHQLDVRIRYFNPRCWWFCLGPSISRRQ